MATTHPTRLLTAEDLESTGSEIKLLELYDGVLREAERMGGRHGEFQLEISSPLHAHVRANRLGRVYPSDTHFILFRDPDTVVMPDVAFVRADRLPPESVRVRFMPLAPDFAVEVLSPSNRIGEIREKIALYQRAGVSLVWLVDPRARAVTVYAAGQEPRTPREGETLGGGDVIPGFRLQVADIFA
jgi:Uma2 family endonuclease